jgi:hypothetical protein
MIKDTALWQAWEDEFVRSRPPDFHRNLALVESMFEHARMLGALPRSDPLEGIEVKIRLARALNVSTTPGADHSGA